MTNPETNKDECVGCGKQWKGSLYCAECQSHNVGTTQSSLGGLVAKASLFKSVEKVLEDCHKCGKPNSVTSVGWFCSGCIHEMSYNSILGRYTD